MTVVWIIDQDGRTSRLPPRVHILPLITDHERLRQVDMPLSGRHQQHPRLGFTAVTRVGVVMRTDDDIVHRQLMPNLTMHDFEIRGGHSPSGKIRLIRNDYVQETPGVRVAKGVLHIVQYLKFAGGSR
jgi:hypothetical protein